MSNATSVGNKRKQTEDRNNFVISNIVSIVSSPSKKTDENEVNAIRDLLQCSRSSAYRQQKTASTTCGHFFTQVKNTAVKWSIKPCIVRTKTISKALRKETVDWIMKNSNVRESPITRDTLLIAYAYSKVKRRVPKLLLECSTLHLHNELISSPDDGGLLGSRHAEINDMIISDTILCSLVPPQLRPMTDNHKMMCGCAICNTSKYIQESSNAWRQKQLKS